MSQKRRYPRMIQKYILMMCDTFNRFYAEKKQKSGELKDKIVPAQHATKEKYLMMFKDIKQRQKYKMTLPFLSVEMTSIDPNPERKLNSNVSFGDCSSGQAIPSPNPYDISFDISILSKYHEELYDIAEQILSRFGSTIYYPMIEFKFESGTEVRRKVPIELQASSLNIETVDIGMEDMPVYSMTFTFIIQGNMYTEMSVNKGSIDEINLSLEDEVGNALDEITVGVGTGGEINCEIISYDGGNISTDP